MYSEQALALRFDDVNMFASSGDIVELDLNEIDAVDGGIAPLLVIAVAAVVIVGAAFVAGIIDGASGQPHQ